MRPNTLAASRPTSMPGDRGNMLLLYIQATDACQEPRLANFEVVSVGREIEYNRRFLYLHPSIILIDVDSCIDKTVRTVTALRKANTHITIIARARNPRYELIAACLAAGADDFVAEGARDEGHLVNGRGDSFHNSGDHDDSLEARIKHVLRLKQEAPPLGSQSPVGTTMLQVYGRIPRIIDSAISAVLVCGESGTGKEAVADGFRTQLESGVPFLKINCGAIAPSLLESELFGHVRGAFTGATADKRGLLESASGGWVFLDEVATLSRSAQVALLRVLENQEVLRVGATKATPVRLRVISASNESLDRLVETGKFRLDLLQRLREAEISLPPLRERREDIPALIEYFCRSMPGGPYRISAAAVEVLSHARWTQGNIRELRNCLRAMTEHHSDRLLTPLSIPMRVLSQIQKEGLDQHPQSMQSMTLSWQGERPSFDELSDLMLWQIVQETADGAQGLSLRKLARIIGMSRSTLSSRLKSLIAKGIADSEWLARTFGVKSGKPEPTGPD